MSIKVFLKDGKIKKYDYNALGNKPFDAGGWIEQSDLTTVFQNNINYVKW